MEENGHEWGGWITFLVIGAVLAHFFWPTKYEGEIAEYWFNKYDGQAAITNEKVNCLSDIELEIIYCRHQQFARYELLFLGLQIAQNQRASGKRLKYLFQFDPLPIGQVQERKRRGLQGLHAFVL